MLDFLIELDTNIFLFLNDLHLPFFDYFLRISLKHIIINIVTNVKDVFSWSILPLSAPALSLSSTF